jgi:hypothetical protein
LPLLENDLWIWVLLLLELRPRCCCWSCFWEKRDLDHLAEECHQYSVDVLERRTVQAADRLARPTAGAALAIAKQPQDCSNSTNAADRSTSSVDLRWRASYRGNARSKR